MIPDCAIGGTPQAACEAASLRELSDPEFFTHWAAVRNRLANATRSTEAKREYDAAKKEYRRRVNGELTPSGEN